MGRYPLGIFGFGFLRGWPDEATERKCALIQVMLLKSPNVIRTEFEEFSNWCIIYFVRKDMAWHISQFPRDLQELAQSELKSTMEYNAPTRGWLHDQIITGEVAVPPGISNTVENRLKNAGCRAFTHRHKHLEEPLLDHVHYRSEGNVTLETVIDIITR